MPISIWIDLAIRNQVLNALGRRISVRTNLILHQWKLAVKTYYLAGTTFFLTDELLKR